MKTRCSKKGMPWRLKNSKIIHSARLKNYSRTASTIAKLQSELEEIEDRSAKELDDLKEAEEKKLKDEITKLTNDFKEKVKT